MDYSILSDKITSLINDFTNWQDSCIIISASDLKSQAITVHSYVTNDINDLITKLYNKLKQNNIYPIILKIEKVIKLKEQLYYELKNELNDNFKYGIIFDNSYNFVLTNLELQSNNIINNNSINFDNNYFKKRFDNNLSLNITKNNILSLFKTESYIYYDDTIYEIDPNLNYRKITNKTNLNLLKRILRNLGNYLSINNQQNGQFKYLYFPITDKYKLSYNILRHLGTIWSLLKLYQYFKWVDYKVVIYRAIKFVLYNFLVKFDDYYFIKQDGLINCGATALASLVLIDFQIICEDSRYNIILTKLINGLKYLQNKDGSFNHKLYINDKTIHTKFQTIYYHDEALFALSKYYKLTKDNSILNLVKLGLDYCIEHKTYENMDQWLSYALNEYINYDDSKKYIDLAINNFNSFLDLMLETNTIFNIMLELLCQSKILLSKVFDLNLVYNKELFDKALIYRTEIQLNGFGWPEIAMFFKQPELVLNSIFIEHKKYRIRIDDLQHTIVGLLYYIQIQEGKIL